MKSFGESGCCGTCKWLSNCMKADPHPAALQGCAFVAGGWVTGSGGGPQYLSQKRGCVAPSRTVTVALQNPPFRRQLCAVVVNLTPPSLSTSETPSSPYGGCVNKSTSVVQYFPSSAPLVHTSGHILHTALPASVEYVPCGHGRQCVAGWSDSSSCGFQTQQPAERAP